MGLISIYLKWRAARFERQCRDPAATQRRVLGKILSDAARTDFAREHRFDRSRATHRLENFRAQVPIRTCAQYASFLQRAYAGDWGAICPSEPFFFAMTAGSSGGAKYIPVTRELKAELDRSVLVFTHYLYQAFPSLPQGKTQFIVGSAEGGQTPSGVRQGFVSGFNYQHLPRLLRKSFVVPYPIFTLADVDDRNYAIGRFLVQEPNLRGVGAISPLNIVNVFQALLANRERLLEDLRSGGLTLANTQGPLPPEVSSKLRAVPGLARRLASTPVWAAHDVFPALEALVCWMSAGMSYSHRALLRNFAELPTIEMPLSASEGIFAIPFQKNAAGGLAAVTGHFLEFLPEGSERDPRLVHELDHGRTYSLVVTTGGGLYRYDMEDLVKVTGFRGRVPVLEFVSKRSRQVSISNERLNEDDVTQAMLQVSERFGVRFSEFLFSPTHEQRYRVLVDQDELTGSSADWAAFAGELDKALCGRATGYGFEREDRLLRPLVLCGVRDSGLTVYLKARLHASALPNAQVKPLYLTPEFDLHTRFRMGVEYGH